MKLVISILISAIFISTAALAQDYDVAILNGRFMDPETNFDAVRNVGIKDGRIANITEDVIEEIESIDAIGLIVATFLSNKALQFRNRSRFRIQTSSSAILRAGIQERSAGLSVSRSEI